MQTRRRVFAEPTLAYHTLVVWSGSPPRRIALATDASSLGRMQFWICPMLSALDHRIGSGTNGSSNALHMDGEVCCSACVLVLGRSHESKTALDRSRGSSSKMLGVVQVGEIRVLDERANNKEVRATCQCLESRCACWLQIAERRNMVVNCEDSSKMGTMKRLSLSRRCKSGLVSLLRHCCALVDLHMIAEQATSSSCNGLSPKLRGMSRLGGSRNPFWKGDEGSWTGNECTSYYTREVIGQDWSSQVVSLFLEDWELARVAVCCHMALDLLCKEMKAHCHGVHSIRKTHPWEGLRQ